MAAGSLSSRKALLARVIAFDAIEPALAGCDAKRCAAARGLSEELRATTTTEIGAPNDDVPLDQYVHMTVESMARTICSHPQFKPDGGILNSAVAQMRAQIQDLSCTACAGKDPVCSEGDHDDFIVMRSGHCIASFKELANLAKSVVISYYAAAGIAEDAWPETAFRLRFVNVKPHPFGSPIQIGGKTDPSVTPVDVSLFLEPTSFNWAAYVSVPYILVHEMFHVLGGVERSPRTGCSAEDPFAEGWLDWIAFEAVRRTAAGTGPAAHLAARFRYPAEQIDRAQMLHLSRTDDSTSENPARSRDLRSGRLAAERFLDLCCRFIESDDEAWTFFLGVSLRLNLKGLSTDEHRMMSWKVIQRIPFRRDLHNVGFIETAKNLRKHFTARDIEGLIQWLIDKV